jgi:uncharacterized membrane protein
MGENKTHKKGRNQMDFKIGDSVKLNTKTYKIVDTHKRSWILESNGKRYKATSKMMTKIKDQNKRGVGNGQKKRKLFSILEQEEIQRKFFLKENYKPMTIEEKFVKLVFASEPENLSCDGESSMTAIRRTLAAIRRDWKACENEIGRKVTEDEAWDWAKNVFHR